MARLRDERGLPAAALRLTVFGRMDAPEDHAAIAALGLAGSVEVRERIPYAEGIAALRAADALFLPTFGASTHYIPGKFYDYLLAGRPILCEGVGDELPGIIARTGTGATVAPGDAAGMAAFLDGIVDARLDGVAAIHPVRAEIERFSAPAAAREVAALLDEIAAPCR
jgi:hypothetical protein